MQYFTVMLTADGNKQVWIAHCATLSDALGLVEKAQGALPNATAKGEKLLGESPCTVAPGTVTQWL